MWLQDIYVMILGKVYRN